jgi:hypothetical protein
LLYRLLDIAFVKNILPFDCSNIYSMRYDHFLLYLAHHNFSVKQQEERISRARKIRENSPMKMAGWR